jgi:hypothetical protein
MSGTTTKRRHRLDVPMTHHERAEVKREADARQMSMAAFTRFCIRNHLDALGKRQELLATMYPQRHTS